MSQNVNWILNASKALCVCVCVWLIHQGPHNTGCRSGHSINTCEFSWRTDWYREQSAPYARSNAHLPTSQAKHTASTEPCCLEWTAPFFMIFRNVLICSRATVCATPEASWNLKSNFYFWGWNSRIFNNLYSMRLPSQYRCRITD